MCKNFPLLALVLVFLLSPVFPAGGAAAREAPPRALSLEAMAGQMIMTGFRGDGTNLKDPELSGILEDIRSGRLGGVIFFDRDWQTKKRGRNIVSTAQVKALTALLQKEAPIPLFIAVDQEGGRVQRLRKSHGFAETPAAAVLGRENPQTTYETARTLGHGLCGLGINVNFAPVADSAVYPDGPAIGRLERAFSTNPEDTAAHAAAFARGLADAGVASSYKHFPGHGSATADSHHKATDITATWSEKELLPYSREHLPQDIPLMVMTGHLLHTGFDQKHPATLSHAITTGLLREKLGWQGLVITDDLEMNAIHDFYGLEERITLAVNAGADIVLFGNNLRHHPEQAARVHAAIMKLVADGVISRERIAESWERIWRFKEKLF